ncbi:hypothetical protein NDU88_006490 [Pleurodeles waltl]|uniref:Uncharacterized protein n=1 Tax=Pleurodeles waltl TaxID=8319 RepID=A0AAV7PL72_PLEWA|nr:hypothetical protein NDU88_006490 [Pleurodeles waltl]
MISECCGRQYPTATASPAAKAGLTLIQPAQLLCLSLEPISRAQQHFKITVPGPGAPKASLEIGAGLVASRSETLRIWDSCHCRVTPEMYRSP